ncbi:hypothetical protein BC831DRAFT_395486 [Entophlyctis helioformis]|nr:hypothetical protein BC831DRAFT_395486 [Entophlyctis helioformis]
MQGQRRYPEHDNPARERIRNLGVMSRSPMGEYMPTASDAGQQLSQLAVPTPGPLDYDPRLPPSGVQYSILGKHTNIKEDKINIGPGPAKYDVRPVSLPFDDKPHWSFGHRMMPQQVKDDTPSPFAYNNTDKTFGKDSLSYTMSSRYSSMINATPGPDRYFPQAEFGPSGTRPKFSFGLKPFVYDDPTPGPHDYSVPVRPPDAAEGPSFTMRRRLDESFRNKGRAIQHVHSNTKPGPNQYYPKMQPSEKAASLKGMHKENKSLKTPGPANYIIPTNLFSGPHYTLTARNVPYQEDDYIAPNPGPTDYNPDSRLTLDKPPSFSLGSRPKSSRHENDFVPGPDAYRPRDRQIRGNGNPKVTIKGRHKNNPGVTPGPADYISHVPAASVTAAQLARNAAPRPVGGTWPHVSERLKSVIEESPGPADYQVKPISVVKPCGPVYSLRKRLDYQKIDQTPGPNAYYALPEKSGAKTTMKSRSSPFVMVFPTNRVDTLRV